MNTPKFYIKAPAAQSCQASSRRSNIPCIFLYLFPYYCTYYFRGDNMASYVSPELREEFETLSIDIKNNILKRNVRLNSIHDLINVLEVISREAGE